MKNLKMYEPDDKMVSLIRDNYDLLQSLGGFGISLGFGDKTVKQTCEDNGVDTSTFLAVVNFIVNGTGNGSDPAQGHSTVRRMSSWHWCRACRTRRLPTISSSR